METSPETMDHGVIQDATQSTSIDLPDSYTDSVAIYQYDASSDSLESYLDIVMTESLSTTLNKEKFVISMSVNGQAFNIEEVIDYNGMKAYTYYTDYNYCEVYDLSGTLGSSFSLSTVIDGLNGSWVSYLGQKTPAWDDTTFDLYVVDPMILGLSMEIYLDTSDNTWAYSATQGGFVIDYTTSPTSATLTDDDFTISGCTQ